MFGNFFNNMYYGKGNRADFTKENLPANRWALFWEMLRIRFTGIVQVNMTMVLFALPLILWTMLNIMTILAVANNAMENKTVADLGTQIIGLIQTYTLLLIPCLMIYGIGLAGMTNVLQQWARDEHASAWSDFVDGVKGNWKQALVIMLIDGVFIFLFVFALIFYSNASRDNSLFFFLYALMIVFGAIIAMANLYLVPLLVSYKLKISAIWRNAILLAIARLPWSLLFSLVVLVPYILFFVFALYFSPNIVMLVFSLFLLLLGFALPQFIVVSYTNATFDKLLNIHIPGAPVNRGLRLEEDDEDEDDADA